MKKFSIRKVLFLLAALFLLTGVEYASAVPAEAAGYKTLYKKFLRKKYKEKGMDGYTKKFFIINIDKKGVPELVYTDGSYGPSAHGVFEVYTIKKGKVKKAGEFTNRTAASSFQYNGKNKAVWGEMIGNTYAYFDRYQFKNGKWKAVFQCRYSLGNNNMLQYYVKNRRAGNGVYDNYFNKHYKSIKWKKYEMKNLTLKRINAI